MVRKIVIGMAVALASLVGCATSSPYPVLESGAPLLESGSIVFTGIDGNLYVAESGREDFIQLTNDATPAADASEDGAAVLRYSAYAWAGERVVYATQEYSASGDVSSTVFAVRPGERPRRLFSQDGLAPFFLYPTPGGDRVGYLGNEAGNPALLMGSVDIQSREQMVHGRGQPFYSAWAPDGSSILTHVGNPLSRSGSQLSLQTIGEATTGAQAVGPLNLTTGYFQSPAYAPDGSGIAVVLRTDSDAGIHLLGPDGEERGRLVRLQGAAGSVAWSPMGNRLAYIDGVYSRVGALIGRLFVARIGARSPRLVSEAAIAHFWAPDGTRLLYFEPFVIGGSGSDQLAYRVAIYSLLDDSSRTIATIRPSPAFVRQIIPFVDQYEAGYTLWSPDSRLVTLNTLAVNGQQVVHLVDTETLNAGDSFRVSYWTAQDSDGSTLGLVPADGVRSRALTVGTLPFFSRSE
ncbi:MAG TPA: hypothetical protein VKA06_09945 [Spirochaetia bacterium]|nr:hypothetical protein [Spirochaetia bacterium]